MVYTYDNICIYIYIYLRIWHVVILVVGKSNFYACPQIVAPTQLVYERLHVGVYIYIYIYIMLYIMSLRYIYILCIIYCVTPVSFFITPSSWGWVPLCFSQLAWLQHADSCRLGSKRKTTPGHRFCPRCVKEKKHYNGSTYTFNIGIHWNRHVKTIHLCTEKTCTS